MVIDANSLRNEYRLGLVSEVYPDCKGVVRSAKVKYKNFKVNEELREYKVH